MNSGRRFPFAAALPAAATLLAAALMLGGPAPARGDTAAGSIKIAVANTGKIFAEMKETVDLKEQLEDRRKQLAADETDKRNKIKEMEDNIKNLNTDNPQYKKALQDLDNEMANFEAWGKVVRLEAERDQKQTMLMLFNKIQVAVGQIAQQDGIDLVIADQGSDIPSTENLTFDQLRALINEKDVLFSSKKVDISDEVVTLLDAQYAKQKAGK